MYTVVSLVPYQKNYARIMRGGLTKPEAIDRIINILKGGERLPVMCKDHQLKGDMSALRECHIKHDLLLLYRRDEAARIIVLADIGTHQDLFGR